MAPMAATTAAKAADRIMVERVFIFWVPLFVFYYNIFKLTPKFMAHSYRPIGINHIMVQLVAR